MFEGLSECVYECSEEGAGVWCVDDVDGVYSVLFEHSLDLLVEFECG